MVLKVINRFLLNSRVIIFSEQTKHSIFVSYQIHTHQWQLVLAQTVNFPTSNLAQIGKFLYFKVLAQIGTIYVAYLATIDSQHRKPTRLQPTSVWIDVYKEAV